MNEIIVVNVGGSLLSPNDLTLFDFGAANKIKELISKHSDKKFILCVGGGNIARKYQKLLEDKSFTKDSEHEVGVALINVNAVMLKAVLKDQAEEKILRYEDFNDESTISFQQQILISAAGAIGHSSDWNTMKLAKRAGVTKVFSLTNIDGVYNKDPKKFPDSILQPTLKWDEYLNIIGNPKEHFPGAKYPVDPLASEFGKGNSIEFYVLSGNNYENFERAINGESFIGTLIN
ncbi:MAG: hypothetical protein ABIM99_01870 [Candidatus Dojkabacteria bacterium]